MLKGICYIQHLKDIWGYKMKLKDLLKEVSTSESFSQMRNLMKNLIPMMLKKEEGGLQKNITIR